MPTYFSKTRIAAVSALIAASFMGSAMTARAVTDLSEWAKSPCDWTGFYAGLNIGGIFNNYDFRGTNHNGFFEDVAVDDQFYNNLFMFTGVPGGIATFFVPNHSETDGGIIGGGQVGYQRQFGHFVLGVEGTFDRTSTSATNLFRDSAVTQFGALDSTFANITGDTSFEASRRAETNWIAAAMGKLGYAQGPFLFYAIGGATWCDINTTAHDIATTDFFILRDGMAPIPSEPIDSQFLATISNTNISKSDDTRFGWTAGGGIEIAATKTVSLALEYRHSDFGSETYHYSSHGGVIFPGSTSVDLTSDQVTFKMNGLLNTFFFGHDDAMAGSPPAFGSGQGMTFASVKVRDGKETMSYKDKDKIVQMPPAEPFSWTGLYAGGHVGGIWNDFDFGSYDTDVDAAQQFFTMNPTVASSQPRAITPQGAIMMLPSDVVSFRSPGSGSGNSLDRSSDSGIIGGGQAGYNYQWRNWVFGVEGDFSGSSTSGSEKFSQTGEAYLAIDEVGELAVTTLNTMRKMETNWSASLRGRIGYAHGPLMLYGTGGATWTDVQVWSNDTAATDFLFGSEFFDFSVTDQNSSKDQAVVMGWTAGGGVEWAFTKITSMALEYRHNWSGDDSYGFDAHHGPIYPGSTRVNLDGDQVTFRVNLLLGRNLGP